MARFISQRNREKFIYEGHMFTFEAFDRSRTIKFWRCDKRYAYGCKARLHTSAETNEIIKEVNGHCHRSDAARIEVATVCATLKRRAAVTTETPEEILDEIYQGTSASIRERLPNNKAMRQIIRRRRTAAQTATPEPVDQKSPVLPEVPPVCEDQQEEETTTANSSSEEPNQQQD
uniref:FLYWCH-type domain-containing protein n=1 Tax=Trichuris muris TaxID=70415 RepID=A0A5S6QNC5_TRIMR